VSDKPGWFGRLRQGLKRSSARLGQGIADLFVAGKRIDAESLAGLEDLLIAADLGTNTATRLAEQLRDKRFEGEAAADAVKAALAESIAATLTPVAIPLTIDPAQKPFVVLVVGVNGSGKTTSIGKLAKHFRDDRKSVTLVAGDTFRAAAVEQLKIWGERTKSPVVARDQGADAAGLAFDALAESKARGDDVLLIDTAGRLQNKADLMAELAKIVRVLKRQDPTAPHEVLLVLDATVGQNAHSQVETFKQLVAVTGLAVTKLDGTAKGGVLVALAERFGLPVRFIGIGEGVDDLRPFDATDFARGLVGLD
jgi:fused signal recognition particle receptor